MIELLLVSWLAAASSLSGPAREAAVDGRSASWGSYVLDRSRNRVEMTSPSGSRRPAFTMEVAAVADTPAAWHVQATQVAAAFNRLQPATLYTLRFRARASRARTVRVELSRSRPYETLNLKQHVAVRVDPETYDIPFRTPSTMPRDSIALGFYAGEERGTLWVEEVEIVPEAGRAYAGAPLEIAGFEPGESWSGVTPEALHARHGRGALRLAANADGAAFATREMSLDLGKPAWRLSMWVHCDAPANLGRMGVFLRSGKDAARDIAFWTFSGLGAGWNRVVIPKESFVQYAWQGTIDWSAVRSVGLKIESNGNGRSSVLVDDLRIEPEPPGDDRGPVIDRVNAIGTTPTTARIECRLDETGTATVEYGASTSYGARATLSSGGAGAFGAKAHDMSFAGRLTALAPARRYHARIRAVDRAGNASFSGDFTFVTEPARAPIVESERNLAVGIYTVGGVSEVRRGDFSALEHVGRTPFTHVSTFFFSDCDQPDAVTRRYLDRAHALGKKVLLTFCSRGLEPGTLDLDSVRDRVRRFRDHPALDAWYLWDEPDGSSYDPRRFGDAMRSAYQVVKAEDPSHPVVLHLARAARHAPYRGSMDALATDTYPVPFLPVTAIVQNLDDAQRLGIPWRFTFQSYSTEVDRWPGDIDGARAARYPSYAEMRAMAYLALNRGAEELWTYAYSFLHDTPGSEWHWTDLTALAQELRRWGPMLVSSARPSFAVGRRSSPALDAATKAYRGREYLIVVNPTGRTIASSVAVKGGRVASFRDANTGRTLAARSGALTDSWAPFAVHLYEVMR